MDSSSSPTSPTSPNSPNSPNLADRSYRLLTSRNIPQSTSQRVVFLRLKGIPNEIIESALERMGKGGEDHEVAEEDWIDRWGHAIAGAVGTVAGIALVKGVRWFNGDDSKLFGEVKVGGMGGGVEGGGGGR